ncbi:MAG: LysM peptidoglycan-binding domain-containing protein [Phycisphaerae bacterium]|nr:LysM peptidoglycan-binding domain-containing protein [Phycisphaerae bacterium]
MRTEAKIAIVILLVVVIGALLYFGSGEEPAQPLGQEAPTAQTEGEATAAVDEEVVGGESPSPTPLETVETIGGSVPPVGGRLEPTPPPDRASITLDFRTATAPTTRPGLGVVGGQTAGVRPNQPASIEIALDDRNGSQPPPGPNGVAKVHVVRSSETLYGISEQYYGRGDLWVQIAQANPDLRDPSRLRVGQKLVIPPQRQAERRYEGIANLPAGSREYKVQEGDSYYSISLELLGSGSRWREILALNKSRVGSDPRDLKAGQVIAIPAR